MKLTPKYWAMWDNTIEDVQIDTCSKNLQACWNKLYNLVGTEGAHELVETGKLVPVLISITRVFPCSQANTDEVKGE